jgi:hypothetical protein
MAGQRMMIIINFHKQEKGGLMREKDRITCPTHEDGEHVYVESDEWQPTCTCGKVKVL